MPAPPNVTRRTVFYIPGYDPIHPRRYRELYRAEGHAQGQFSGYQISVKARRTGGHYGWEVEGEFDGHGVETGFEVLVWSDIVRRSMDHGILWTYASLAKTAWIYLSSGTLFRLAVLRRGPVLAALYPAIVLLAQMVAALVAGWLVQYPLSKAVHPHTGWLVGLPLAVWMLKYFKRMDRKFFAYYLMHDYAYTAQDRGAVPPELSERMAEFGQSIEAALASDVDEVLVVGHSSGATLAVTVLADLIRRGRVPAGGPALALLSLGQVIPMSSFLPEARRLRRDLNFLASRDDVFWLDVTAPGDGCCFALCDPVAVSGVQPEKPTGPLVVSAAFRQTLSADRWEALRRRFFKLHFQYLCAFDNLPGTQTDYDYFRITAGPLTLAARFADRPPSASRIDVPASGHTSMAAA